MIDWKQLFNRGVIRPLLLNGKEIQKQLIAVLKTHPEGMERDKVARICGVGMEELMRIISLNYQDIPIGYDRTIDTKLYWGRRMNGTKADIYELYSEVLKQKAVITDYGCGHYGDEDSRRRTLYAA